MRRLLVIVGVLALVGAACGEDDDAGVTVDDTVLEDAPGVDDVTPDDGDGVSVEVSETDLGEILVDGEGMTLYMFTEDSEDQSACEDECLTAWPPLTVDGEAVAGDGVDEELLGTFTRDDDGSTQVTYDGHPLYFYATDSEPGDTTGQGVVDSWYVLSPDGTPIQDGATGDEEESEGASAY